MKWRADSLGKTQMLGKIEGRRRRGWQRTRWLDSITDSMDINLSKFWEMVKDRKAWLAAVHWTAKSWIQLSGWNNNKNDLGFLVPQMVKTPHVMLGDPALIPRSERSPREGNVNPLQYSWQNSTHRGVTKWLHGVTKHRSQLSD